VSQDLPDQIAHVTVTVTRRRLPFALDTPPAAASVTPSSPTFNPRAA
jgi:hypothetical protein